jgi:hypothetical protein
MTEPIQILEERLNEITKCLDIAKLNKLDGDEMDELKSIRTKYNVCIDLLKLSLRDDFIYRGEPIKTSMEMYVKQWKSIRYLKKILAQKQN